MRSVLVRLQRRIKAKAMLSVNTMMTTSSPKKNDIVLDTAASVGELKTSQHTHPDDWTTWLKTRQCVRNESINIANIHVAIIALVTVQ